MMAGQSLFAQLAARGGFAPGFLKAPRLKNLGLQMLFDNKCASALALAQRHLDKGVHKV
jgi:hypothetical protein